MNTIVNKLQKRIEVLEKDLKDLREEQKEGMVVTEDYAQSVYSSPSWKEVASKKNKSDKCSNAIDIAYLYSVPLVMQHNFKMSSMGLPIDHNAEITDIIKGLESTNKMVNFKLETATVDALSKLCLQKPKIVHLSCHGDYDKDNDTYYLAFEDKEVSALNSDHFCRRLDSWKNWI